MSKGSASSFCWVLSSLLTLASNAGQAVAQPLSQCTMADFERCLPEGVTSDALADLLGEARVAIDAGDWALALERLDRAAQILPLGVTLVARANALWQLGRTDEALALCDEVALDVDPVAVERAAALRALIESTERSRSVEPSPEASGDVAPIESGDMPADEAPSQPPRQADGPPAWQTSDALVAPVGPLRARRRAILGASSALVVGFGSAAIALGVRSNRLEDDAREYDRNAPGASIGELNGIERDASRASSQANACIAVTAFAGGVIAGLLSAGR